MCFVWLSEQTVTIVYVIDGLVLITEVESVYSAVRTEFLCKTGTKVLKESERRTLQMSAVWLSVSVCFVVIELRCACWCRMADVPTVVFSLRVIYQAKLKAPPRSVL
jgi:hypothetical protein